LRVTQKHENRVEDELILSPKFSRSHSEYWLAIETTIVNMDAI
jgi:hypothetical protein